MNYLHYELDVGPNDVIEVTLDHAANVQLMDSSDYYNYKDRRSFRYYGASDFFVFVRCFAFNHN
jgi:hypothetical protein